MNTNIFFGAFSFDIFTLVPHVEYSHASMAHAGKNMDIRNIFTTEANLNGPMLLIIWTNDFVGCRNSSNASKKILNNGKKTKKPHTMFTLNAPGMWT